MAIRVAGREPLAESYHYASLEPDFQRVHRRGRGAGGAARPACAPWPARPGPGSPTGPGWIRANLASFQRLLRPLTDRLGERIDDGQGRRPSAASIAGAEVGALLGWMSTRVLGQYDLLVIEDENPEDQDIVYYVGPNVLALEKRFAFPPREFRLWLALHEVTHRAQFTGVPWLRPHFLVAGRRQPAGRRPRPQAVPRRPAAGRRARSGPGRNPLDEGGLVDAAGHPRAARRPRADRQGLMSLLEGHGDVTMDRAGADRIPSADRFRDVLHQRRQSSGTVPLRPAARRPRGQAAASTSRARSSSRPSRASATPTTSRLLWEGPEYLPTLPEIRNPDAWLSRVADVRAAAS